MATSVTYAEIDITEKFPGMVRIRKCCQKKEGALSYARDIKEFQMEACRLFVSNFSSTRIAFQFRESDAKFVDKEILLNKGEGRGMGSLHLLEQS